MAAKKESIVDSSDNLKTLEQSIDNAVVAVVDGRGNTGEPQDKFSDIIKALEAILSEHNIEQKSRLSGENITGMLQAANLNGYLSTYYGFRLESLDYLIRDKLIKTISYDGLGREELIRIVEALKATLETNVVKPTVNDKLMGR